MTNRPRKEGLPAAEIPWLVAQLKAWPVRANAKRTKNMTCLHNWAANQIEVQVGRIEALEDALQHVQLVSSNHGGWIENDPAKGVAEINRVATTALNRSKPA